MPPGRMNDSVRAWWTNGWPSAGDLELPHSKATGLGEIGECILDPRGLVNLAT